MSRYPRDPDQNSVARYYVANLLRLAVPGPLVRARGLPDPNRLSAAEREEVRSRTAYCNRVETPFDLPPTASRPAYREFKKKRKYCLDMLRYLRRFPPHLRISYRFGDKTFVPDTPSFVKARPIAGDNRNSILFKLNRVRHFNFVRDRRTFASKRPTVIWRGNARREHRRRFFERWFDHERCDLGVVSRETPDPHWEKPYASIREQLEHRYVLSLEGNDVASNLKWVMSSNSLCVMPAPKFETWFLEGQLVGGRHYVELRDDYADLEEKLDHYDSHPEEAQAILENAHAHVARFTDERIEEHVALAVLEKFFVQSGQLGPSLSGRDES